MKLQHRIIGEGKPLIILHGLFGSSDNWQTHAKKLAEYFEVTLVDLRNHGHSPWSDAFTYKLMVQDLHDLFQELRLEKPIVVGHSMGGKLAMHYDQAFPGFIEKLIVVDMGVKAYPPHHAHILAAIHAIEHGHTRYTQVAGLRALREAIARSSTSGLASISGITFSVPIFAVLSTPHTTGFMRAPGSGPWFRTVLRCSG